MTDEIHIRQCREDESQAVLDLWQQADAVVSPTETSEQVRVAINHVAASFLVAEFEDRITGTVIGTFDGCIRSLRNPRTWVQDSQNDGNRIVGMDEFRDIGPQSLAESVPQGSQCYVSIDIDVLDLPLVPGCVSAEPNGMSYAELRDALAALSERAEIVGFDLVEVNPQPDVGTGITSYLAAHTILEFLGSICAQPRWMAGRKE